MIVLPLMELRKLFFACVLLMAVSAIYEVADIFCFPGHRLFDDVLMAIISNGDGGMEQP